jgi:hypothetical protein
MKGVLPWLVRWACRAGTRDFYPVLAALVGQVPSIFSSPFAISLHFTPSPSKLCRQSCLVTSLLICVSVPNTTYPLSPKTNASIPYLGADYVVDPDIMSSDLDFPLNESDSYISTIPPTTDTGDQQLTTSQLQRHQ